ncbi:putative TIM-barrel protein, nifR3 family [Hathewaya proteolytica DSM 3090]|uniref:tRNA-dihydrouridine synthase n=1 Tax=Hathewaya proteolytica DSM 3090 TaxID=1121331 RepID=A0A1M6M8R7_9CLOT|nr:tRNA dihydrouridine synthase DusB [Hathewaya proteolytica]SHJ79804.1 putative TIM-barrel protein, nifR3 family [Hathewaya proteolytica DSM 3090]
MKIGDLKFDVPVFLAPMAGVTDVAYREICSSMGCGLTYTEMVSAKGLYYGSENTEALMKVSRACGPSAIQIFGNHAEIMSEVCQRYINPNPDFCLVDINMGCPVSKIVKNGEGSALMKEPLLAGRIVEAMKKVSTKPVTVKMRIGFDDEHKNAVEFAKVLESSGADAIAVHGRTRQQMYEGKADYDMIAEVKSAVAIPVIGNGDVFSAEDARNLRKITGCDGILVARGAMGNPWIFQQIDSMIRGEEVVYPTDKEKVALCIEHYELALKYENEYKAVREMRKQIGWYLKGIPRCTDIKKLVNSDTNPEKVLEILKAYENEIPM